MANVADTPFLQDLGAGSRRELALKMFSGQVNQVFPTLTKFSPFVQSMNIASGSSFQFPWIGRATHIEHTPGTELPGSEEPLTEERTIPVDNKAIISHNYIAKTQEQLAHFDMLAPAANQFAAAIAREVDERTAKMIALGSRQDARGTGDEFSSGSLVKNANGTGTTNSARLENAYPVSQTGAKNLRADLDKMAQNFRENNIPEDNWVAFLGPYLNRVLLMDQTLSSHTFVDPNTNDMLTNIMQKVSNFKIEISNNMPTANDTSSGEESAYAFRFDSTAVLCMRMGSVGSVQFGEIDTIGPDWYSNRQATLLGASRFSGIKWLDPAALGEIYANDTTYTLTDGVWIPQT